MYGQMYTHYRLVIDSPLSFVDLKSSGFTADDGDVIIPASGETAEDIAVASVIRDPGILLGGDLNVVRLTDKQIYPEFLAASISHGRNKRRLASLAQGKTIVHLHNSDIKGLPLSYPSLQEQKRIVGLIQTLDSLISAAKRKETLLKSQRRTYLQLMFPRNGEKQPRLRFSGFTGEWKHQNIGKMIVVYSRRDYLAPEVHEQGSFPVIQQGNSPIAGYSDNTPFNAYKKVVLFGDHTLSLYKPSSPFLIATDGVQIIGSSKISADFLPFLLTRYLPSDKGYKRHLSQLKSSSCAFPQSQKEQILIGHFFQQLDSLITAAENKVEALQRLKQGYMQKMFV